MANLSKQKRDEMLTLLDTLKEKASDEEIIEINKIKNHLLEKKYGLVWEKHTEHVDDMMKEYLPIFTEDIGKEIVCNDNSSFNFLLEGDNLQSLYLLQKTHRNRIDVIYIDPPYNTLKEDFIYDDKMIDAEDGYAHSKWLSFMRERLNLAKSLLSDTGVIFISIDDREQAQLKLLCYEIFSEQNVQTLIWAKEAEGSSGKMKKARTFRDVHEYIIACYKDKEKVQFNKLHQAKAKQTFQTTNLAKNNSNKKGEADRIFEIVNPENGMAWTDEWKYDKEVIDKLLAEGMLWFGKNGNNKPRQILPTDERREVYAESIIVRGSSTMGRKDLEKIFGVSPFDNPKPVSLIEALIYISSKKDSIVLDFFAGSGTTGQAVLELNQKDNGERTFILCTNNEISALNHLSYLQDNNYMTDVKVTEKTTNKTIQSKIDDFYELNPDVYQKLIVENKSEYETYGICKAVTYPRMKAVITGIKPNGEKYEGAVPSNMKYFNCSWIERKPQEYLLSHALCAYVKEMVELETGFEIDGKRNVLILNRADLQNSLMNEEVCDEIQNVWIREDMILDFEEKRALGKYNYRYVPHEYFGFEIMEASE